MTETLNITEIYTSIQGESSYSGLPCTFVRLTGCPLRCRWCDTAYAFNGGTPMTIADIVEKVCASKVRLVELTGGEPLAQHGAEHLVSALYDDGFKVLIETGGSEPIQNVVGKAHVIMDLKCPGSGMHERNLWENLNYLKPTDEIKFVIANREDFAWAESCVAEHQLDRFQLLFSPAFGLMQPKDLVELLLASGIQGRFQLQMHKHIWHPRAKGV